MYAVISAVIVSTAKTTDKSAILQSRRSLHIVLKHKDDKQELLTEEEVELLTSPMDLAEYKDAITDALLKATKRNIESETDSKNAVAG